MDTTIQKCIESFFKQVGFVRHHLDSYANMIQVTLPDIIRDTPPFEYDTAEYHFKFSFENFYLHKPSVVENVGDISEIYPNECRLRNLLYGSPLFVQIRKKFVNKSIEDSRTETVETVLCGTIPVMVKSIQCRLHKASEKELIAANECVYDQGGYFIVGGTERILVGMERMAANQVYVFPNSSDPDDIYAEILSVEDKARKAPNQFMIKLGVPSSLGRKSIQVSLLTYFKKEFPLGVLFKALGKTERIKDDILQNSLFNTLSGIKCKELITMLDGIMEECHHLSDKNEARNFLTSIAVTQGSTDVKKENYIDAVFQKELLPHVGIDQESYPRKVQFITYMVQRLLLTYYGLRDFDDHDHCKNKRTDSSGVLLGNIFKQTWNKLVRELTIMTKKKLESGTKLVGITISQLINSLTLTKDLSYCCATGNWSAIRNSKAKTGVSQVLNRFNFQSYLSHCRRVVNPMPKDSIMSKPRQLHNTSWGMICNFETPEGHAIGLVKNLALSTYISTGFSDIVILEFIHKQCVVHDTCNARTPWIIFCNGKIVGWTEDDKVYIFVKSMKIQGIFPFDMGIYKNDINMEIYIFTDAGRTCRPLLIVKDNTIGLSKEHVMQIANGTKSWDELYKEGVVEMIDVGEQETLLVCVDSKKLGKDKNNYTHCEISPTLLIGVCSSVIPYANHNPAARIVYQCLWKDEPVLMADGTYLPIKDIEVGDQVVTFNPETFETSNSRVISQFVRKTNKKVYEITTINGRKIKATEDHKFMTNKGWLEVRQFDETTTVAVGLNPLNPHLHLNTKTVVLDEKIFRSALTGRMKNSILETHIPPKTLYSTSSELPILARMFGFLITDGSAGIYHDGRPQISITIGHKYGAELFENDVESLGFNRCSAVKVESEIHGTKHRAYQICHTGPIASLFIALGLMTGKRTVIEQLPVPDWIMSGSMLVKQEFLAGFQGGDGCRIRCNEINHGHNFVCAASYLSKVPEYVPGLIKFCEQISTLFSEFGIISKVVTADGQYGKIQVGVKLKDSQENLLKFFDCIGYRYDIYKIQETGIVAEYIRYQQRIKNQYLQVHRKIMQLSAQGKTSNHIAAMLNVPKTVVRDRIYRGFRYDTNGNAKVSPKLKVTEQWTYWNDNIKHNSGYVFLPLESVVLTDIQEIADITTESENHSFLAGDQFCVHNSSMSKQALSVMGTNHYQRMDTMTHQLHYPQKSICPTRTMELMHSNDLPAGENAVIFVCSMAYDQEDAIILNKNSVDRGMFRSTFYRTYKDSEIKSTEREEKFAIPSNESGTEKLQSDGTVGVGSYVSNGDVLVGKISTEIGLDGKPVKLRCIRLRHGEDGTVDSVLVSENPNGTRSVKTRIRQNRIPEVGDKFAAPHSQKGVCSILMNEQDLPYTAEGIRPDIVFSPNSWPSRMTVGHVIECYAGKSGCVKGKFQDSTIFDKRDIEAMGEDLVDLGYERRGWEEVYNGTTGELMDVLVFVGVCYYQRLKHMVQDKWHVRGSKGPITTLTHQPAEGDSKLITIVISVIFAPKQL